jgi:hypothetical protein
MISVAAAHDTFSSWVTRLAARRPQVSAPTVRDEEAVRRFHQAVHVACRRFVQAYPQWAARGFDEPFLRREATPLLLRCYFAADGDAGRPTGMALAQLWDRRGGAAKTPATRMEHLVQAATAADELVHWLRAAR